MSLPVEMQARDSKHETKSKTLGGVDLVSDRIQKIRPLGDHIHAERLVARV